jgi:FAD/FMN-containing dehydrogenase
MPITAELLSDAISELLEQDLARPWEFEGQSGYRLIPQEAEHVAEMLNWAQTYTCSVAIAYVDACRMDVPVWLDLSGLNQVRQYPEEDFIIEVETGLSFGELEKSLARNWQTFPLSYAAETTIADILAEDRPALETGLRGAFRDYVLKTEIATPDGQLTISGADVVKNVTGYDLAKLYVGGQHAFGVVTSVTLKLMALPQAWRHWCFPASSLQTACIIAERLLASSMPLSMCEIFQSDTHWMVFTEFCGDDWLMVETQATLTGSLSAHNTWGDPQSATPLRLTEDEGLAMRNELQRWPLNTTRLEVALPLSQWVAFSILVSKQTSLEQVRLQIRPAAGLVYVSAPMFPSSALRYLQKEALALGGFAQILQISNTDAIILSEAEGLLNDFNLPEDFEVRRLLNGLKKGYDPYGVLHTPRLPL